MVISGHTSTQLRLDACGAGGRRLLAEEEESLALRVVAWPQGSQSPATEVTYPPPLLELQPSGCQLFQQIADGAAPYAHLLEERDL